MTRKLPLGVAAAALVALATSAPATAQTAQQPFFPYPIKTERLENGLTVTRVPTDAQGLVAYYTIVRVGSRNEVEPGHTGFAHFFEHVMFKGTESHPEGAREKILGTLGLNENAWTSDDITVYHLFGPTTALGQVIELEADRFRNLRYSKQTFQTEAKAVLGEYHKSAASPYLKMEEVLLSTAFTTHPYQHTTLGFYEDIQAMPDKYEYSLEFFERWYTPDNTHLLVVGDFDDAQLMAAIREHYGPWQGKVADVAIPAEPRQREQRVVNVDWRSPTLPKLVFAYHTPAARTDTLDSAIQSVLTKYLVGETSTLYKELVLEKQLVANLSSWSFDHRDPSLLSLVAEVKDARHLPTVKKAFDQAIRALATGRVDAKRVEAIKSNLRYELLMDLESPAQVAQPLAWAIGVYGSADALDRVYQNIAQVRPQQLVEFAKRHFVAKNRTILTLTPKAAKPAGTGAQP